MNQESTTQVQEKTPLFRFSNPNQTSMKKLILEMQDGMLALENSVDRLSKSVEQLLDKF
jgi:hypothetical protein